MTQLQRKIYFLAPAGVATGGPEAIHRLCKFLIDDLKINVRIIYMPSGEGNPVHENYAELNIPIAQEIEDEPQNIIILPDYYPHMIIGKDLKKIKIWIWWLSIDFFYKTYHESTVHTYKLTVEKYRTALLNLLSKTYPFLSGNADIFSRSMSRYSNLNLSTLNPISRCERNLCQSFYAEDFLKGKGLQNIYFMGDFTEQKILSARFDVKKKKNIVLYSPAKGINFTRKIISAGKDIIFIPLIGYTRQQLTDLLETAKVYIDFGNHPGRDRIPREAAMYGCCILTSLRGSAKYYQDIPISSEYKFINSDDNVPIIIKKIHQIFNDYEKQVIEFDNYRSFVVEEDKLAHANARELFSMPLI